MLRSRTHTARPGTKLAALKSGPAHRPRIKNPLTPIQLSAERIARKFQTADGDLHEAVDEGTKTIVSEVKQLKRMVDEFSRFARMPAVHLRHAQLAEILQQAAALYRDVKPGVSVSVSVAPDIELLMDPERSAGPSQSF